MDFREIDKILQQEFANKKVNAEKLALENLNKANANPAYKKLDALERQLVLELSKSNAKTDIICQIPIGCSNNYERNHTKHYKKSCENRIPIL